MGGGIGLTACNERLSLPLLHAHEPECMPERLPSAQPRPITSAPQTDASAPVIRLSRWALTTTMLGDGGVHFDPAA